jgi:acetoin utilization protein AcuC
MEQKDFAERRVVFLSSPAVWQRGHGAQHPLKPERLQRTHKLLEESGALDWPNVRVVPPRPATHEELTLFHAGEYVDAVRALSAGESSLPAARYNFGPGDNPVFTGMYESEGLKVGSALQAAELLAHEDCDVAFSYSGGLHHGGPDFASGFCVFNDAAVAIHWLLQEGLRIAYVDVDVHHGDGVQNAFYDDDRVLTISLHQDGRTLFPGTGFIHETGRGPGVGYSVNVPLPPHTTGETYLWAFRQVAPPLLARFQPDLLVTQLGVDTHFKDPLASLGLTTHNHQALFNALGELSQSSHVMEANAPVPWLALGGGGYDIGVVPRSWALAFAVMAGRSLPEELPTNYRQRYGGRLLHDEDGPAWLDKNQSYVRQKVEDVVTAVRETYHLP